MKTAIGAIKRNDGKKWRSKLWNEEFSWNNLLTYFNMQYLVKGVLSNKREKTGIGFLQSAILLVDCCRLGIFEKYIFIYIQETKNTFFFIAAACEVKLRQPWGLHKNSALYLPSDISQCLIDELATSSFTLGKSFPLWHWELHKMVEVSTSFSKNISIILLLFWRYCSPSCSGGRIPHQWITVTAQHCITATGVSTPALMQRHWLHWICRLRMDAWLLCSKPTMCFNGIKMLLCFICILVILCCTN